MEKIKVRFPSGELSLEGVLYLPGSAGPFPAVVVCHPHPLYGGSMENNVVNALCAALVQASLVSFKFNFRGVGGSQGEYSGGKREAEDVSAAIDYVTGVSEVDNQRLGLAGYSAGAGFAFSVGASDTRIRVLAAVSPPLAMYDFGLLKSCLKPKLLIAGNNDDFIFPAQFQEFCQNLPEPKECVSFEGADHFWWGYESLLAGTVTAFLAKILKKG